MKKILVFVLFFVFCNGAAAWSIDGHVLVVDLATESMSPAKIRELEIISRQLERSFDTDRRLYLLNSFDEASDIAKIAAFPDRVRDLTLTELFGQWDLSVPEPLAHLADLDTSNWHYKNHPFYTGADEAPQCDIADEINIASIYPLLLESYELANEDMSKAILLAFIIHFVADAHQPMHSISRVELSCDHDLGGNTFCATERGFGDRCDTNLHSLWDGAVGLFDRFDTYETLHAAFTGRRADEALVEELDMDEWLEEGFQQARFIYTLREERVPDDIYIADGQHIAFNQLVLAADRLGRILEDL